MKLLIEESVLRQALDFICAVHDGEWNGSFDRDTLENNLITALDAADKVEPVAWLQIGLAPLHDGDVIARTVKPKDWNPEWWRFEPLYTHPAHAVPEKVDPVCQWPKGRCGIDELLHDGHPAPTPPTNTAALQAKYDEAIRTQNELHEHVYQLQQQRDELATTLDRLIERADVSDHCQYGTLSTAFVRDMCKAAIAKLGSDKDQQARDYAAGLVKGIRVMSVDKTGEQYGNG